MTVGDLPTFYPRGLIFLHNGIVGCGLQDRDRLARHVAPAECRVIVNALFFGVPEERYNCVALTVFNSFSNPLTLHSAGATYWAKLLRSYGPLLIQHKQYGIDSQLGINIQPGLPGSLPSIPLALHTGLTYCGPTDRFGCCSQY